jgi:hypothetical protein
MIRSTVLACVLAFGAPAMAQEGESWETRFLLIANPCMESQASNKLAICEQANSDLLNRAASYPGPMPRHEDNVYRAMRGVLYLNIAVEMGAADGSRSKRSCEAIEKGWADVSLIDTQYSPQRAADMQSIRSDVLRAVRVCREDFGKTPAWAPDLPAN